MGVYVYAYKWSVPARRCPQQKGRRSATATRRATRPVLARSRWPRKSEKWLRPWSQQARELTSTKGKSESGIVFTFTRGRYEKDASSMVTAGATANTIKG